MNEFAFKYNCKYCSAKLSDKKLHLLKYCDKKMDLNKLSAYKKQQSAGKSAYKNQQYAGIEVGHIGRR